MPIKHEIFWKNLGYRPRPQLKQDIECDYLIVGGGITGVSMAYFLKKFGAKKVVLAEKSFVGSGATGKAAGTLVTRGEADLTDLIDLYGKKEGEALWKEVKKSLHEIKNVIDKNKIDCDAELEDTLICGFKNRNWNNLKEEYEAEKKVDRSTKFLEGKELDKEINSPLFTHGVLSKKHALNLNPLKFIQGFSRVAENLGADIYENTLVLRTAGNIAETPQAKIKFKHIIWAIDVAYKEKDIKNLKTTIIVTGRLSRSELAKTGLGKGKVIWDSHKNEHYLKATKDGRLLAGFGGVIVSKHMNKNEPHLPHLEQLKKFIKNIFPYIKLDVEYAWSGYFGVNKHYSQGPLILYEKNKTVISAAGSQVVCFMSAEEAAKKLLGVVPRGIEPLFHP